MTIFCVSLSTSAITVYGDSLFSSLSLSLLLVLAADPADIDILAVPSPSEADHFVHAAKRAITFINDADIIAAFVSTLSTMLDHVASVTETAVRPVVSTKRRRPGMATKRN